MPQIAWLGALALSSLSLGSGVYTDHPAVEMVSCDQGSGTAFRVGEHTMLSVNHVTKMTGCLINGRPFAIAYASKEQDFSILRVSDSGPALKINCGGFPDRQWMFGIGHAEGRFRQRLVAILSSRAATRAVGGRFSVLVGRETVLPGMSGGPLLNSRGEVVGTINAYNPYFGLSFSRSPQETPVCPKR